MTNQEIFDMLADLEERTFYIDITHQTPETLKAHEAAKKALEAFAKATGCHN